MNVGRQVIAEKGRTHFGYSVYTCPSADRGTSDPGDPRRPRREVYDCQDCDREVTRANALERILSQCMDQEAQSQAYGITERQ